MFKLDLVPLPPRLLQNRESHIDYIKHTQENANILWEIVELAKAKHPLDSELDFACKYATRIQELLVYVKDMCPNAITHSSKKIVVTPRNNVKKVRFAEPMTSSSKTQQVESSKTSDSNTPVLSSTGVKCSTSNYGSKPTGNKKNDRISQTPSRNKKNNIEAQPRKVNKLNHVAKPICDVDVKHSLSNANSEILCASCNKSMFDVVHDKCLLDFVVQIVLWYLDSGCSKHMTGNRSQLMNFVSKFLGTVRFGNDQIARIMGYGDYQLGNVVISRVYYVEGLGHNLFSVGQFCDADLELAKDGLARGIPRLKFQKDHLCSACSLGKSKKSSHQPKAEDTNQEKLYLLHMDLCGPMRVASINGKRYILVIVDDYSRFTWVRFLKTKDEAPAAIIKCIKNIQVRLKATVQNVRTDNGTKFVNQTLREWYENVGITHQTSVARTPQQNGVVKRRNQTLVEAARTMLIFSRAPLFLWAEAINTTCYTQNCSLIRHRYNKTPYELMQDKKPDLSFFHVFGSLCYPTNDHDDLGKFDAKADIGIFVGYAPAKKAFRIYNRRTRIISETIHVTFNELTAMASDQFSSGPRGSRDDWDRLFQPMFDEYFNHPPIVDAPSTSIPTSQEQEHSPIISQGFEESPKTPTFHDDPLNESPNEDSTSHGSSSNVRLIHTPLEHIGRWTKDHPITNVIEDASYFVKIDESGGVLKNMARLVAQGFRQEDGIDFEESFAPLSRTKNLQAVKWNLSITLNGTINMGLWYSKDTDMSLTAYADANHAGCQDNRRSTSGSAQFLDDKLVRWSSKKQKSTAISSTGAEYIALSGCCSQILWMRSQLTEFCIQFNKSLLNCYHKECDSFILQQLFQHSSAKHIDIATNLIKEQWRMGSRTILCPDCIRTRS
ncbi:retrovirus-related pol polyprotein from transposon TNT 1-94 [Tanacetum coccineum]